MEVVNFLVDQVFVEAPIFLGLVALIGLLLQRKSVVAVIEGTAKTIVGILILFAGIDLFLGSLIPLTEVLADQFDAPGVLPDCFGPFGVTMQDWAREVGLTFVLAFLLHLAIVRVVPWQTAKNLFLTGHIMLFYSALFVLGMNWALEITGWALIVSAGVLVAIMWTIFPAITRPFTRDMTADAYTLGHLNHLAAIFGTWIGMLFKGTRKSDEIELPGFLRVFNDYTVLLAFVMPALYIIIGLVAGATAVEPLAGEQNWILWLLLQGLGFAAGVAIVLFGVRMFLAAIIPAFQGISQKLLPGAKPGLDCPVFYPFAPVAMTLGFLADFGGALLSTGILIAVSAPVIIIPGPIFFFFDGALAGVFGDRFGGWKGAIAAGAFMGLWVHLLSVFLYYVQPQIRDAGVIFSGPDWVLFAPLFWLFNIIGSVIGIV